MGLSVLGFKKLSPGEKAKYLKKYPNSIHGKKTKAVKGSPAASSMTDKFRAAQRLRNLKATRLELGNSPKADKLYSQYQKLRTKLKEATEERVAPPNTKGWHRHQIAQLTKTVKRKLTVKQKAAVKALKVRLALAKKKYQAETKALSKKAKLARKQEIAKLRAVVKAK